MDSKWPNQNVPIPTEVKEAGSLLMIQILRVVERLVDADVRIIRAVSSVITWIEGAELLRGDLVRQIEAIYSRIDVSTFDDNDDVSMSLRDIRRFLHD